MAERAETPDAGDQIWKQFTRGNIAWDRLLALNDSLEILEKAKPDAKGLADVQAKRDELDARLTALRQLTDVEKFSKKLEQFEQDLELAEGRLMRVDTQVPIPLLRRTFEVHQFLEQSIARYVSILVRHIDEDPERRDRVDFLSTRLFSERLADGRLQMRPYADVHGILRALIPDTSEEHASHAEAVAFFRDAIRRLSGFHTLQELFDSGFYVDVRGYKISLLEEFLDPDVLYAAAELNTAIHNRMKEFEDVEGVQSAQIREKVQAAEREIKGIFEGVGEVEQVTHTRFSQERLKAEEEVRKRPRRKPKKKQKATRERQILRPALLLLGTIVVLGGSAVVVRTVFFSSRNRLVAVADDTLETIHPLLKHGSFTEGKDARAFVGELSSSKWLVLSPAERRETADEIAHALDESDVHHALIYRDGVLAIQIAGSRVVMVE